MYIPSGQELYIRSADRDLYDHLKNIERSVRVAQQMLFTLRMHLLRLRIAEQECEEGIEEEL